MDSAAKYRREITAHACYHEQAAAFAACGYAQESGKPGVAYATSGPGATNLVTGIANAYFDSVPVVFLTGQVDTYSLKGELAVRQRGFQETDVVSIVRSITKYAVRVDDPREIAYYLERAFFEAVSGNPGPVLLDLPADVQRAQVDPMDLTHYPLSYLENENTGQALQVLERLMEAERPCILAGNGVKQSGCRELFRKLIEQLGIPSVFSMPAFDILPWEHPLNFGFIGANGHRYANFVLAKSDLILVLGSRLDLKQVGMDRKQFAPDAEMIRIDIDDGNLSYHVHKDEIVIHADLRFILPVLLELSCPRESKSLADWIEACTQLKENLTGYDDTDYTRLLRCFGSRIPENSVIMADVGQSGVWVAQHLRVQDGQSVHMSAGHGAMGYSLPAAVGAYYGRHSSVVSFNGDGGLQMNIQELQFLVREGIPVKVVVLNNRALGMIRGFQEANFNGNYFQTVEGKGYSAPDFSGIARAYGLSYARVEQEDDIRRLGLLDEDGPALIEIILPDKTVLEPNFGRNRGIQDQQPYLDRELFDRLMDL